MSGLDMTAEQKRVYMLEVNREQLVDHITSGAKSYFIVYGERGSLAPAFDNYADALKVFNSISAPGYYYIHLPTRIGTGVVLLEKRNP